MAPNRNHCSFEFLTSSRLHLSSILTLVTLALGRGSFAVEFILLLIALFKFRIHTFPHFPNNSCDLSDSKVGMLDFDLVIDVHTIEEKRAKSLFRGLWRYVDINIVVAMVDVIVGSVLMSRISIIVHLGSN
mgnify:CR=1 FL=1